MSFYTFPFLLRWLICGLALALSACVYVPVVDQNDAASSSCKTFTKTMSLETIELHGNIADNGCVNNRDCAVGALAGVIVVTAGSAIISGSIVVTGNTLHWLEYQGTCSDGYLSKAKELFLASIGMSKPTEVSNKPKAE
jgi:hypothetical protein